MSLKDKGEGESLWLRHQRMYRFLAGSLDGFIRRKFNYTYEKFDPRSIEGPLIVIPNHACAWDPLLVGTALSKRQMYFVMSEHMLRKKIVGPLLDYIAGPIPRKKASSGAGTVMSCLRHLRAGHSICLFAEGEQSWNGISRPVFPATGKMVRQSGATLVTYRLEGAYLSLPRWAHGVRRGRVYGHPVGIYPPEELRKMKPDEINALIDRDLAFNVWDWQASMEDGPVPFRYKSRKGGPAERLEKSISVCPACGEIGTLTSSGDMIKCSCGFSLRYADTGQFEPPVPFSNVAEWEEYDRDAIGSSLDALRGQEHNATLFSDGKARLTRIGEDHTEELIEEGRLSLDLEDGQFMIRVGQHGFPVSGIRDVAQVLSNILLFTDGDAYFQIYSEDANLRKYHYAWEFENK